jgi:hypothetical protein
MKKENIGPTIKTIPAINYKSCDGCKFHKREMLKSGRDPVYSHYCKNEEALCGLKTTFGGRYIGDSDKVPSWCPVLPAGDAYLKAFNPLDHGHLITFDSKIAKEFNEFKEQKDRSKPKELKDIVDVMMYGMKCLMDKDYNGKTMPVTRTPSMGCGNIN